MKTRETMSIGPTRIAHPSPANRQPQQKAGETGALILIFFGGLGFLVFTVLVKIAVPILQGTFSAASSGPAPGLTR